MSVESNKAAIRRHFEQTVNKGNLDVIDENYSPDFVGHEPTAPGPVRGPEKLKEFIRTYRTAFPDLRVALDDLIGEGDVVVARWTARGTHTGHAPGIAPTGRGGCVTGVSINRFKDGKVVEGWGNWDTVGMLQQLGLLPPLEQLLQGASR